MNARAIYYRILEIEQEAKRMSFTDEDWATHPLAVEYRSLLKQWWEIPAIEGPIMKDIIYADRPFITSKAKGSTWCQRQGRSFKMTPAKRMYVRLMGGKLREK